MTPPVVPRASKEQVALKVVDRLKDTWGEIGDDPNLEMALKRHLMRLPRRYALDIHCLLYTSPSPRDQRGSRMPSSA